MLLALILLTAAAVAPSTSRWHVQGEPGAITSLTGIVRSGGRIVADRMVDDADKKRSERSILSRSKARSGTCAWAIDVRPFTRLRRFAKDGRLLWEWNVGLRNTALSLANPGDDDCLSPDGGRLLVTAYHYESDSIDPADPAPVELRDDGVIAVDHHPRFVAAKGARTGQEYGERHKTQLVGWRRGSPATLLFDVVTDADAPGGPKVTPDFVVLAGKH